MMENTGKKVLTESQRAKVSMLAETSNTKKIMVADITFEIAIKENMIAELKKKQVNLLNEIGQTQAVFINTVKDCMKELDISQIEIDENRWGIDLGTMTLVRIR